MDAVFCGAFRSHQKLLFYSEDENQMNVSWPFAYEENKAPKILTF